jgi:hypothetical protein
VPSHIGEVADEFDNDFDDDEPELDEEVADDEERHRHAQSHDQTSTSAHEATKRSLERDEHLGEGARGPHARTHDADFLYM